MARADRSPLLRVLMDDRLVGHLTKTPNGTAVFSYDENWVSRPSAEPVSTTLPVREEPYDGAAVLAVFDNLLPDSVSQRSTIAGVVGADGDDAYGLLTAIGNDCAGALQFIADGDARDGTQANGGIAGEELDEDGVEALLKSLPQAPLGLAANDGFRIALAGAQKKTALLFHEGRWVKPHGRTPTTHILKTQIGKLPTGTDLSNSVENEFYCLKLAKAFGFPVAEVDMHTFGQTQALIVERFDRRIGEDGRIVRVPQEDMCQALSVHPTIKYERQGGPGVAQILEVLKGSETALDDQETVLKAQLFFWLTGATDGHAKNFSIFLGPGGTFRLAPLYDILTVEPSIANGSAEGLRPRLAMSVGMDRTHRIEDIGAEHFIETAEAAGLPQGLGRRVLEEVSETAEAAMAEVEDALPAGFSDQIHETVKAVVRQRRDKLQTCQVPT